MHNIDAVADYPGVQLSWKRILSIAQNTPDPATAAVNYEDEEEPEESTVTRMQSMGRALQNMFTITSQDEGYKAFILTVIQELNYDCPIAMTFVKHIIDYSEIPSETTLIQTTKAIINSLNSTSATEKRKKKINSSIIWSILARKFAGNLSEAMFQDEMATTLIGLLVKQAEDPMVKLFALLALESFALTGSVKKKILDHPLCIISVLNQNLESCHRHLSSSSYFVQQSSPHLSNLAESPNLTLVSTLDKKYTGKRHYHNLFHKSKLFSKLKLKKSKRKKNTPSKVPIVLINDESIDLPAPAKPTRINNEEWSGHMQLLHCLQYSLGHIFLPTLPPLKSIRGNVCFNPNDSTSHCKISTNGLEISNDTWNLESARATTSVDSGIWYYEVLLLTNGVIQVGWGTSKCIFLPEEGCGVGDDSNGFAFDTYRSAIWASSEAIYPQRQSSNRCKIGDVIGTLLDMDQGICTFFINGQDLGYTVSFHTNKKKRMLGLYPMISLTNHQHVLVNFSNQPWYYGPSTEAYFQPISDRGAHAVKEEEANNDDNAAARKKDEKEEEYDWDGPLCILCFSEPKDVILLPCQHDGFGKECAKVLDLCPLCRTKINERKRA